MRTPSLILISLLLLGPLERIAAAGGIFLPAHGVRGLARAGAFTAGGDDPGGIWYNPANIGGLPGVQALIDFAIVLHHMEFQRVDSGGNLLPAVANGAAPIPIPTLGLSTNAWHQRLFIGLSLSAPYAPLHAYPEPNYGLCSNPAQPSDCVDTAHRDAPQRYTMISTTGTAFFLLDLAAAYQVLPQLTLGVSLQNLFARWVALNSISSFNAAMSGGPEHPEYDFLSQLTMTDIFNPSAKFGLIYQPHRIIRIGASVQLPFWIDGDAKIKVQIPFSPLYEKARTEGDQARVGFTLPLALRLGVELRPLPSLRLESGFDWDQWSVLDALRVNTENIWVYNIPGFDRVKVPNQRIELNLRDTFTLRQGVEYFLTGIPLAIRAGYIFERGAVRGEYLSVLATDTDKHALTVGLGYTIAGYRADLAYAHLFYGNQAVDFRESRAMQVNPVNPSGAVAVGGGSYRSSVDIFGLGLSKAF